MKTVCDRQADPVAPVQVSQAVLKEVKAIVEAYLPGLDEAEFQVNEYYEVREGSTNPTAKGDGDRKTISEGPTRAGVVVTVTKSFQVAKRTMHQYARVTLNENGKMVKLAVSR